MKRVAILLCALLTTVGLAGPARADDLGTAGAELARSGTYMDPSAAQYYEGRDLAQMRAGFGDASPMLRIAVLEDMLAGSTTMDAARGLADLAGAPGIYIVYSYEGAGVYSTVPSLQGLLTDGVQGAYESTNILEGFLSVVYRLLRDNREAANPCAFGLGSAKPVTWRWSDMDHTDTSRVFDLARYSERRNLPNMVFALGCGTYQVSVTSTGPGLNKTSGPFPVKADNLEVDVFEVCGHLDCRGTYTFTVKFDGKVVARSKAKVLRGAAPHVDFTAPDQVGTYSSFTLKVSSKLKGATKCNLHVALYDFSGVKWDAYDRTLLLLSGTRTTRVPLKSQSVGRMNVTLTCNPGGRLAGDVADIRVTSGA